MVRKILQVGEPILNQVSQPIPRGEIASRETRDLIADMQDTLNRDPDSSAGLSAVQIGVLKRVYIVRRIDLEQRGEAPIWEPMINPQLEVLTKHKKFDWEGCLSIGIGANRLFAPVPRYSKVRVKYYTPEGESGELTATGYLAHIVQHEQDHLEGKLFLRYVEDPATIWLNKDLEAYIAEHGSYPDVGRE